MPSDPATAASRIRALVEQADGLKHADADKWIERARLAVIAAYGDGSSNLERFDAIRYSLGIWTDTTPTSAFRDAKMGGVREATGMLEAFAEDLDAEAHPQPAGTSPEGIVVNTEHGQSERPVRQEVFVVHGRNEAVREQVARLLEQLDLTPVILGEQTDRGRTIIEKFEQHAVGAGYAVILLTADDFGRGPGDAAMPAEPNRARQNVILELGYFMGSLGRSRTAALYEHNTELPSDIHGMLYIPLDSGWPLRLAKEMRDAGLDIDLNKL